MSKRRQGRATSLIALTMLAVAWGGGAAAAQQVTMPLDRYDELRARARTEAEPPEPPEPPPAPYALESDELDLVAGTTSARIVQTLSVRLLGSGWLTVPVGEVGSFVGADLGGAEGRVDTSGATSVLRLRGKGTYRVRLESVVPVVADAAATRPTWRFVLRLPPAAVARGTLSLAPSFNGVAAGAPARTPAAGKAVGVARTPGASAHGASGDTARNADAGGIGNTDMSDASGTAGTPGKAGSPGAAAPATVTTAAGPAGGVEELALGAGGMVEGGRDGVWRFAASPGKELEVRLLGRAVIPERARLPLRFEALSATVAVLSHTRLEVHAAVAVRVDQGRLGELRLRLPAGFTVERVQGVSQPLAGWKVAGDALVVTPLEPALEGMQVAIELTAPPRDDFAAPLLVPAGSVRTTLLARAELRGDGLLAVADHGATRPPDRGEMAPLAADAALGGAPFLVVADATRPPRWHAEWAERTEMLATQIDTLWVEVAAGDAGTASYQVWASVRNRGNADLTLALPDGFRLAVASRDGVPLVPGAEPRGLVVPLLSRDAPQVVHLAGVVPFAMPRRDGPLDVPLPVLSAPAAQIHMRLLMPGGHDYALVDKTRLGAGEPPPQPSAGAIPASSSATASPAAVVGVVGVDGTAGGLAGQLQERASDTRAFDRGLPMARPPGSVELLASWSALAANPGPLSLRVAARKEEQPWF